MKIYYKLNDFEYNDNYLIDDCNNLNLSNNKINEILNNINIIMKNKKIKNYSNHSFI